jgi:CheY-like chemotaxis protein
MNNPKIGEKSTGDEKPGRILIVDDDPDFRELLDDFQPDLVTLDVMMPGLTTEEILEKLIKKKCKPKIILLTVVRYSKETLEKILNKGNIVAYIDKPFDLDDFIDTINKLLQTYKLKR